ncbi:ATP-binding protein [Lentzea sp. NBC_00516]|uniref:ATP-binding protein n=1 Tax=Lentzea sp. NBC_00516 TaxID=2903582 RepID=UPI002E817908|nr:ATP-binding protein [Lentzea sp. NBC_00516]WUD28464.1 ATP-binding protein [Lentzea sp. NBC_00516]
MTTARDSPAALVLDLVVDLGISLSELRARVTTALENLSEDHCYDVVLVVTELVSNVLDHTPGSGRLRILRHDVPCEIVIEVDDSSPKQPVHGSSRLGGTRGRGIVVVDNLAREWGSRVLPGRGKTVFASVPCPEDVDSGGACGSPEHDDPG